MDAEQKKAEERFQSFCKGMPCREMIRKMMEGKKSGQPFNCAEMMSQMMKMWGGDPKKEKESASDSP